MVNLTGAFCRKHSVSQNKFALMSPLNNLMKLDWEAPENWTNKWMNNRNTECTTRWIIGWII